jgi:uncharacterized protein YggE
MSERNRYLALAALVVCLPFSAAAADEVHIPSITVTGRGEASSAPNLAHVSVGVVTQSKTAADALAQNNAAMQRLMDALKARGIESRDVQTSSFHVSPQYPHDDQGRQPPRISGYQVSNQVRIRVRQIDRLGAVLDQLVQEGANQVHGVGFEIAEPEALLDGARTRAMENARRKAELLAKAAGVRLGRPLSIQEGHGAVPPPMPMYRMAAQESSVPIASGEQTVEAQVTVSYAIESP